MKIASDAATLINTFVKRAIQFILAIATTLIIQRRKRRIHFLKEEALVLHGLAVRCGSFGSVVGGPAQTFAVAQLCFCRGL